LDNSCGVDHTVHSGFDDDFLKIKNEKGKTYFYQFNKPEPKAIVASIRNAIGMRRIR